MKEPVTGLTVNKVVIPTARLVKHHSALSASTDMRPGNADALSASSNPLSLGAADNRCSGTVQTRKKDNTVCSHESC